MRISSCIAFTLALLVCAGDVSLGQETASSESPPLVSKRRTALMAAVANKAVATANAEVATQVEAMPEVSATVLRATTATGVSKAVIYRQPDVGTEGVRVAALQEQDRIIGRAARSRSRASAPTAPNMERKPFLVGFRRQVNQESAAVAKSVVDNVTSASIEPEVTTPEVTTPEVATPEVPDSTNYTFGAPPAPETSDADAQAGAGSPEPSLDQVSSNADDTEVDYCERDCRKRPVCNLGCEKKLFPRNPNGLEVGGWISQGYHNRDNPLLNNRSREWNLHQAWLYAGKEASQDDCDWDFGYRADLLYGIDAQDLQAFGNSPTGNPSGWDNSWDFGSFGWALPQLYVEAANADWNVKLGKFFSPFGYEVIGATDNFFYSHAFTGFNSEPFTVSGLLAEKKVSDTKSYIFGVTAGWDSAFESNDGGANLIFGTRNQITDNIALAITNSWGDTGIRGSGTLTSAVAEVQLNDSVDYVLHVDVLNLNTNQEFGIVQYLFREINPCLSLGARLEWWKSDQFFTSSRSTYNYTMGVNYRRNANLTIRPELRFDWGAGAVDPGAPIIGVDLVRTF